MNTESEIVQARLLEAEKQIVDLGEKRAKGLSRTYKRKVTMLEKRKVFEDTDDVDEVISSFAADLSPKVADAFAAAGMSSKDAVDSVLSWDGRNKGFKASAMSQNQLKGLAMTEKLNGKELTDHLDTAIGAQVRKDIKQARIEGVGIKEMKNEIFDSLGGQVSKREIETVSRTYTATASSYAKKLTYEQNSDVIKGYDWCSTLENGNFRTGRGTCPRCGALDQRRYKTITEAPPWPLHPR